ncbi:gastrin/cholecystokinin-like peptide [Mastacembelus armatus]|uniref:Gastrin/cholecystokinin-like peptide n=1 Tax=Mastacembelus armatus TaxID=205130 RepID=A0A3Q3M4B2_9TELE|nr:gastrin/cholecystokinin-like peptide [Mastacembelus armatus]
MPGKLMLVFAFLAVLLLSSAASLPESFLAREAQDTNIRQQLLSKTEKAKDPAGRQNPAPQPLPARMERRAHLSEDEREIVTKQIMQAISEIMNSECMSARDYQGWVDFGRRDAE